MPAQETHHAWTQFIDCVKKKSSQAAFGNWISPIQLIESSAEEISLEIPNVFVQNYLLSNYHDELISFLPVRSDGSPSIRFVVSSSKPEKEPKKKKGKSIVKKKDTLSSLYEIKLNENYRFSTFIDGSSNQFAKAAAIGVANRPGKSYNPLFIYGEVGVGKTHILHSIGHHMSENFPQMRVQCISTEGFVNDLVRHLTEKSVGTMKGHYRSKIDALLMDDIHFLVKRRTFEEELLHTFKALQNDRKQIVITSDQPPSELDLSPAMKQWLEGGLAIYMNLPDLETRVAILQNKAEQRGLKIGYDVAFYIAERIQNNIRQLEGAVNQLSAHCRMMDVPVSKELVEQTLSHILQPLHSKKKVTVNDVLEAVSKAFGVDQLALQGRSRVKEIVIPRQVAMYLAKTLAKHSLPDLAKRFGKKNHSTIIHACRSIESKLGKDPKLKSQVDSVKEAVLNS